MSPTSHHYTRREQLARDISADVTTTFRLAEASHHVVCDIRISRVRFAWWRKAWLRARALGHTRIRVGWAR